MGNPSLRVCRPKQQTASPGWQRPSQVSGWQVQPAPWKGQYSSHRGCSPSRVSPSSTPCAAFASSVCMWGADLQDNTYIPMPAGCSSGPWWKFSPLSGVGLSLRCVLRVVFTETYQTGRCPLPWSHAGCWASEVGPSVHIPTSWSLTRLPDVQPQAHSRSAVFSVTVVGVGYTRCFCLPVTSTAGVAVLPPGVPPHGTRGDARSPRVWAGASRGPPVAATAELARPARGPRPFPPGGRASPLPGGLACPGEPRRGEGRSAERHVSSWRRAAALEEDRWGERQREVRLSARPQPRRGGSPSSRAVRLSLPGRGTMASSEEDGGGNGAVEEKENGKKRRLGALATAWLIFYNVAMTAG